MGKFGNTSLLVCQCNGSAKIIDAEKRQEIEHLLIASFNQYAYSERLKKSAEELGDRAIKLLLSEGADLEQLLMEVKKKVEHDS